MVVARRIPLIDEEAQAVLAMAVFIRRPGSPTPRNVFSEWFFIDEGRIRTIYTAMFYPPPELAVPNWPPYEGNWPLPATSCRRRRASNHRVRALRFPKLRRTAVVAKGGKHTRIAGRKTSNRRRGNIAWKTRPTA